MIPAATPAQASRSRSRSRPVPGRSWSRPGGSFPPRATARCRAADEVRPLDPAVVVGAVLDADQRRLGPPLVAPLPRPRQRPAGPVDPPEEVVRGEEGEVAAQVAEALDHVVLVRGHVLRVARVDDEVVEVRQRVAVGHLLDVGLGEEVGLSYASTRASAGSPGRTCGTAAAPPGGGRHGRAAPSTARPSRTTCRPSRCRPRRGSCTPARCWSAGRRATLLVAPRTGGRTMNGAKPIRPSSASSLTK